MKYNKKHPLYLKQVILFFILLFLAMALGNLNKTETKDQSTVEQMGQSAGY